MIVVQPSTKNGSRLPLPAKSAGGNAPRFRGQDAAVLSCPVLFFAPKRKIVFFLNVSSCVLGPGQPCSMCFGVSPVAQGCVMNDNREVLLVKEKHRHAMWKFPGGLADPGEGIGEAAVREVLEETGVEADFRSVLSMRHQHDVQFGNSDLYFVCRLMLKEGGALDITKCSHEIADACWMPLDQFKKQTRHSMLAVVADMLEDPEAQELTR